MSSERNERRRKARRSGHSRPGEAAPTELPQIHDLFPIGPVAAQVIVDEFSTTFPRGRIEQALSAEFRLLQTRDKKTAACLRDYATSQGTDLKVDGRIIEKGALVAVRTLRKKAELGGGLLPVLTPKELSRSVLSIFDDDSCREVYEDLVRRSDDIPDDATNIFSTLINGEYIKRVVGARALLAKGFRNVVKMRVNEFPILEAATKQALITARLVDNFAFVRFLPDNIDPFLLGFLHALNTYKIARDLRST